MFILQKTIKRFELFIRYIIFFKLNIDLNGRIKVAGRYFYFTSLYKGPFLKISRERFYIDDDIKTILDLGSTIGEDLIRYDKIYNPDKVVSVEASQENHKLLLKNIEGINSITSHNKIVDLKEGNEITLVASKGSVDWTEFCPTETTKTAVGTSIDLDSLIREFETPKIDFLKISINGAELKLLKHQNGAWIKNFKYIAIMIFEDRNPSVKKLMEEVMAGNHLITFTEGYYIYGPSGSRVEKSIFAYQ